MGRSWGNLIKRWRSYSGRMTCTETEMGMTTLNSRRGGICVINPAQAGMDGAFLDPRVWPGMTVPTIQASGNPLAFLTHILSSSVKVLLLGCSRRLLQ